MGGIYIFSLLAICLIGLIGLNKNTLISGIILVFLPLTSILIAFLNHSQYLAFVSMVFIISHLRIVYKRYGKDRLERITKRTWRRVSILVIVFWFADLIVSRYVDSFNFWILFISWVLLFLSIRAVVLAISRTLFKPKLLVNDLPDKDLPTITVAIPARNETHALTDALRSVVASNYPKLEIIVLDDCSQDSTPEIIRTFAHDGIRFIQGTQPASGWLGKNFALETLYRNACGEFIIFCGVDIRFQPDSISKIVSKVTSKHSEVLSIMPYHRGFNFISAMVRPLRYYLQLAWSPWPHMNSCWIVNRQWLESYGGFGQNKHLIIPEKMIAKKALETNSYSFILSDQALGVSTRKRFNSQIETAIRTIYPYMKKEPLFAVLYSTALVALICGLLGTLWLDDALIRANIMISGVLLLFSYFITQLYLQPKGWFVSFWFLPFAVLTESILTILSMIEYEFGRVNWKGRNVCIPIMKQKPGVYVKISKLMARSR